MPGVVISTAVRTGPSSATVRASSQLFVVGQAERGPSDEAVLVESLADFEYKFGGYLSTSYLHPTIEAFFEEGGTQAYVARVVGAGATTGTLALLGTDAQSASTVLTLDANGEGDWSNDVEVSVEHIGAGSSFRMKLYYDTELVYNTGTVTSVAQAAGRINTSAVASRYVVATHSSSATTRPAVVTLSNLTAGDSDHVSVTESDHVDGLDLFTDALGTGAVSLPDIEVAPGTTTYTSSEALIEHANSYNRIAILHGAVDDTTTDIKDKAADLQTASSNAEHAALYFPWVDVPSGVVGVTRRIPPDGYIAAKRALAHNQTGPHIAAAGLISSARFITGTALDVNKVDGDDLDENFVNAIRVIQNSVRVYGARSLSSDDENFRYITTQDIVNSVVVESQARLEDLVFTPVDGRNEIFSLIEARLIAVCATMRDLGALYQAFDANGRKLDSGYTVKCDASLNPVTQLAGGTVKAKVGIRTSSIGDKIEIEITKSNLTASVVQ